MAPSTSNPGALQDHELAALFPLMEEAELQGLAQNIKEVGLKAPVTLYEGRILDGRNRYRACALAGVEPKTREFPAGSNPLEFVLSANLHRRHLTESQRALVAARLAKLPHGRSEKKKEANSPLTPTITEAAQKLSVGTFIVKQAKKVLASKVQTRAVESGRKTVNAAVKEIKAAKTAKEIRRDTTGYPIPEELWPLWERKAEVEELLKHISKARCAVRAATDREDILFAPANVSGALADLNNAWTRLVLAVPYAVCAHCQGRNRARCESCKSRGMISKHHYDTCVPLEIKAIREKECL